MGNEEPKITALNFFSIFQTIKPERFCPLSPPGLPSPQWSSLHWCPRSSRKHFPLTFPGQRWHLHCKPALYPILHLHPKASCCTHAAYVHTGHPTRTWTAGHPDGSSIPAPVQCLDETFDELNVSEHRCNVRAAQPRGDVQVNHSLSPFTLCLPLWWALEPIQNKAP